MGKNLRIASLNSKFPGSYKRSAFLLSGFEQGANSVDNNSKKYTRTATLNSKVTGSCERSASLLGGSEKAANERTRIQTNPQKHWITE